MKMFFFDVMRGKTRVHDFHGSCLRTVDEARDVADTMSLDLACLDEGTDSEVQVRDTVGALLFTVKARPPDLVLGNR